MSYNGLLAIAAPASVRAWRIAVVSRLIIALLFSATLTAPATVQAGFDWSWEWDETAWTTDWETASDQTASCGSINACPTSNCATTTCDNQPSCHANECGCDTCACNDCGCSEWDNECRPDYKPPSHTPYEPDRFDGNYTPDRFTGNYEPDRFEGTYEPDRFTGNYQPDRFAGSYEPDRYTWYIPDLYDGNEYDYPAPTQYQLANRPIQAATANRPGTVAATRQITTPSTDRVAADRPIDVPITAKTGPGKAAAAAGIGALAISGLIIGPIRRANRK